MPLERRCLKNFSLSSRIRNWLCSHAQDPGGNLANIHSMDSILGCNISPMSMGRERRTIRQRRRCSRCDARTGVYGKKNGRNAS